MIVTGLYLDSGLTSLTAVYFPNDCILCPFCMFPCMDHCCRLCSLNLSLETTVGRNGVAIIGNGCQIFELPFIFKRNQKLSLWILIVTSQGSSLY